MTESARVQQTPGDGDRIAGSLTPNGTTIQGRYLVSEKLGRGGMAAIYRATDLANRRDVALKQLTVNPSARHYATTVAFFEREFHTLAELSHPHVVEAYDYGRDERGPYYTMELLDGGDLRKLSPLRWRDACSKIYDVCSSLALIHSRRLVHRDVSPGNVHSTPDGRAKLIDFGAMVPMGQGGPAVGTPHFVAPEVVNRSALDARTDLFSLGATFYYALTREVPYPAADFASLSMVWQREPAPPSHYVPDIPPALDELVLQMIAVEPVMRPRTAFEVMQRLAAITGVERVEPDSVSRAYLATPVLLGREAPLSEVRNLLARSLGGQGGCALIRGVAGVGRSRMLDACALAAKTFGATVLRGRGNAASNVFRVATELAQQLEQGLPERALAAATKIGAMETLFEPEPIAGPANDQEAMPSSRLRDFAARPAARYAIQTALSGWFLELARKRPLVIAIDDFLRLDEPSAAFLASLASRADRRKLCILACAEEGVEPSDRLAFEVLEKHSTTLSLSPLTREDTARLLESVFGDVPNIAAVSEGVHAVALGNPRATMDLAQHLVDRGRVRYERGTWTLPARLEAGDLPSSAEEAMRVRLSTLSPLACQLAEVQALATHKAFTREDYAKLGGDATATEIDRAMTELVAAQVVASDGALYTLAHRGWASVLEQRLDVEARTERHRALAVLYEGRSALGVIRHALLGGLPARALDELAPLIVTLPEGSNFYETTDLTPSEVAATFGRALSAAERIGRSERELNDLRRWLASLAVISDDEHYQRVAPAWLARLSQDSGLTAFRESDIPDPQARLGSVMQRAFERYAATPDVERVYRPDEAIKGLAHYVGISMAICASRLEAEVVYGLPDLLEPFAPLSPLVETIWQNSIAARDVAYYLRPERATQRWKDVFVKLRALDATEPQFVGVFRRAVAHAIGSNEAAMGLASADSWAKELDDDPVQRVSALNLRRIVRMQQGDWEGAELLRRRTETLRLQTRARQMFNTLVTVEMIACAMAGDLTGVKQVSERVAALAARAPGWVPVVHLAEGFMHSLCESYEAALLAFDRALELAKPKGGKTHPVRPYMCALIAARLETLLALERNHEARDDGEAALAWCHQLEIVNPSYAISRALALAESKTGACDRAAARLDEVITSQREFGITGLHLGATYEARARTAIAAGDEDGVTRFSALTASEFRHGRNSPLGARYERLMREARTAVKTRLPALGDFQSALGAPVTQAYTSHTHGTSDSLDELEITGDLE